MKYTDILDKINNIKILCLISNIDWLLKVNTEIIVIDINNDIAGDE